MENLSHIVVTFQGQTPSCSIYKQTYAQPYLKQLWFEKFFDLV